MRLAVMQPYLFPYIGYVQLMGAVDHFVFLDDVAYINKGWINRNRILQNGKDHLFTIPLNGASQNRLINTIEIAEDGKWRAKFLRGVQMAYSKAPYYAEGYELVEKIVLNSERMISSYIADSFRAINHYLDIFTHLSNSSEISLGEELKGEERILAICKHHGCTEYVNPIGGTELYARENFERIGMTLNFIKTHEIRYKQFGDEFIPWLSILDVIMFNGKQGTRELLAQYTLI